MRNRRGFSVCEIARVAKLARQGCGSVEIAAALDRKPDSIRHLCALHGISLPPARTDKWTNDDLNELCDLHTVGMPVPAIAARLHRTAVGVGHMLERLGLSTQRPAGSVTVYSRICRGAYDRLRGLCEGYNLRVSGMARILLERVLGDESLLEMALDGDPERTSHALHHEAPMPLHSLGAAMSNEPIPLAEMSRRYLGGHWQPAPTFALTMSR